jgi:hypothetical protein
MNTYADNKQAQKSQSVADGVSQKERGGESSFQFADNRPEAVAQLKMQEMADDSPQTTQLNAFQNMANARSSGVQPIQMARGKENWDKLKSKISITSDPIKMAADIAAGKTPLNADGASMARRMDKKEQIASPELLFTPEEIKNHLGKFADGAHAFITPEKNGKIKGEWGWGLDKNFVAPLSEADALVSKAQGEKGIFTLEEALGIPHLKSWSWASEVNNPENAMWRYIIPKPENYTLSMASGRESGAYKDEWIAGGKSLGGATEAVIDKIPREKLLLDVTEGKVITEEVKFPTTQQYFDEFRAQDA